MFVGPVIIKFLHLRCFEQRLVEDPSCNTINAGTLIKPNVLQREMRQMTDAEFKEAHLMPPVVESQEARVLSLSNRLRTIERRFHETSSYELKRRKELEATTKDLAERLSAVEELSHGTMKRQLHNEYHLGKVLTAVNLPRMYTVKKLRNELDNTPYEGATAYFCRAWKQMMNRNQQAVFLKDPLKYSKDSLILDLLVEMKVLRKWISHDHKHPKQKGVRIWINPKFDQVHFHARDEYTKEQLENMWSDAPQLVELNRHVVYLTVVDGKAFAFLTKTDLLCNEQRLAKGYLRYTMIGPYHWKYKGYGRVIKTRFSPDMMYTKNDLLQ